MQVDPAAQTECSGHINSRAQNQSTAARSFNRNDSALESVRIRSDSIGSPAEIIKVENPGRNVRLRG